MGDWLKNKYKEILINGLISFIVVFLGFWAYGYRDSRQGISRDIQKLYIEKASNESVDRKFNAHLSGFEADQNAEIATKADRSVVESMDHKLDLILMKLK